MKDAVFSEFPEISAVATQLVIEVRPIPNKWVSSCGKLESPLKPVLRT